MEHKGTKRLETERLILRKFELSDTQNMFDNWASNPNVTKFLIWQTYTNTDDVRAYIQSRIDSYANDNSYEWVIEYKENHQAIGSIGVVDFKEYINCALIGYCLGEEYWHKGIMTDVLNRVIKFLFEEVGVNRIEATHDVNNPNSGKVMEKCGMKYEGTLRQAAVNNQGICDSVVRSVLREEYRIK